MVWQKHIKSRKPIQLKRKAVKKAVKKTKSFPNNSDASIASPPRFPSIQSLLSKDGNDKRVNPGGNCLPLLPFLPPAVLEFLMFPCVVVSPIISSESLVTKLFSGLIIPGMPSAWIGIWDPSNFPAENWKRYELI